MSIYHVINIPLEKPICMPAGDTDDATESDICICYRDFQLRLTLETAEALTHALLESICLVAQENQSSPF